VARTQLLRQAWSAPLAALLVVAQVVIAVTEGLLADENQVATSAIALVGAVILATGLWKRPLARLLGNALIVVGSLFGAFWFWTGSTPLMALIVIVGVVISEARTPARAATP
jgi:hypothetical protein